MAAGRIWMLVLMLVSFGLLLASCSVLLRQETSRCPLHTLYAFDKLPVSH